MLPSSSLYFLPFLLLSMCKKEKFDWKERFYPSQNVFLGRHTKRSILPLMWLQHEEQKNKMSTTPTPKPRRTLTYRLLNATRKKEKWDGHRSRNGLLLQHRSPNGLLLQHRSPNGLLLQHWSPNGLLHNTLMWWCNWIRWNIYPPWLVHQCFLRAFINYNNVVPIHKLSIWIWSQSTPQIRKQSQDALRLFPRERDTTVQDEGHKNLVP